MNLIDNLTDTQKKILYSAGLIVVAIIFAFLIYVVFFKEPEEEYINVNGEMIPASIFPFIGEADINAQAEIENVNAFYGAPTISQVANGGSTLAETILDEAAQDATLAANGSDMQYYDAETGQFYKITADGEKVLLTDEVFKGVQQVNWSNDSNKAVLEFEDDYNLYYDFDTKKQTTLNKEMEEFTFSPNDDEIGFKFMALDKEDRWLGVMDPKDKGSIRGIERLGDNANSVQVDWSPSGRAVATYKEYKDGDRQSVIPLGLNGENFKEMTVEGRDFDYEWSPTGQEMLYSVFGAYSDYKPTLWIVDAEGEQIGEDRKHLEINTWVDKCTFSGTSEVYCAVPNNLPTGAGYGREVADEIPDSIYKINVKTGKKELVAIPMDQYGTAQYTVESMSISADGTNLFFTDSKESNLHKVKLK